MAVTQFPSLSTFGRFTMDVTLGGDEFTLDFRFDTRLVAWYMSIIDADGVVVRSGIKLVVAWPLTYRSRSESLPRGVLAATDISQAREEIAAQLELGDRVVLMFAPWEDVSDRPSSTQNLTVEVVP